MKIDTVLFRVGQPAEIIKTDSSFHNLYKLLNCTTIEVVKTARSCLIVCDEEGRWANKPNNRIGIVGDFLLVGPIRHGDFSSISGEDLAWALKH